MSSRTYGTDEQEKLKRLINEGVTVLQEVEDLQASLKDTVKAIAEELDIKPSLVNKAIKVAFKHDWERHQNDFEELENIVVTVGRDK